MQRHGRQAHGALAVRSLGRRRAGGRHCTGRVQPAAGGARAEREHARAVHRGALPGAPPRVRLPQPRRPALLHRLRGLDVAQPVQPRRGGGAHPGRHAQAAAARGAHARALRRRQRVGHAAQRPLRQARLPDGRLPRGGALTAGGGAGGAEADGGAHGLPRGDGAADQGAGGPRVQGHAQAGLDPPRQTRKAPGGGGCRAPLPHV
mmetsp:Transcript_25735/g.66280  ORF Transcript_25735/g.66280 Transcript_25735/m.66280 type:complete len:205 (-) Transcript_25735:232-846(-)